MAAPIVFNGSNAKLLNSDGILNSSGAAVFQGFKNYISNPNSIGGWTASGAGVTLASTTSASRPDNSTQAGAILVTRVSGTTDYVYKRFTLDSADYTKLLQILWNQAYAGSAGDYVLELWSNTASNYGGASAQLTITSPNVPGSFTGGWNTTFISSGSAAPYLELRIRVAAGTTALYLNDVMVTPGILVQGAAVSAAITFVPVVAASFGTITNAVAAYTRNGSCMCGNISFKAGTVTAAAATITIPGGFHLDTSIISTSQGRTKLGTFLNSNGAGGSGTWTNSASGAVTYDGTNTNLLALGYLNTSDASNQVIQPTTTSSFLNNNGNVTIDFNIPIAEWAGNGTVNLGQGAQVEYAEFTGTVDADSNTNGSQVSYGPSGTTMSALTDARSKYIVWQYPPQDGDLIFVQVSVDSGVSWSESVNPFIPNSTSTSTQGARYVSTTAGVSRFYFGRYAANTTNWASTDKIRFVKAKPSAPVGFGLATSTVSGLYTAGAAAGSATNIAASAGNVGEFIQARQTAATNFPTSTQYGDAVSISLTPGDWDVTFVIDNIAAGSTITNVVAGISSTTGNSSTGLQFGDNALSTLVPTAATDSSIVIPAFQVLVSATTTYYGKVNATYSVGTPQYRCRLSARRMR